MLVICKVCGAENELDGDIAERCPNCDNDLLGHRKMASLARRDQGEDTVGHAFAAFYGLIFVFGLWCYVMSKFGNEPGMDPLALPLTVIAIIHLMVIKRVDEIPGFYKGDNRYNILRGAIYYGIVGLIVFEVARTEVSENKDNIFYLLMMMQSLMLCYTYCFGKKRTAFNYFSFFYSKKPQVHSTHRSTRRGKR